MAEGDKKIVCQICGTVFIFSRREQIAFKKKGYTNIPRRCPVCRKKKRGYPGASKGGKGAVKQVFTIKCAGCNRFFESPTKPHPGLPMFCQACKVLNRGTQPKRRKRR